METFKHFLSLDPAATFLFTSCLRKCNPEITEYEEDAHVGYCLHTGPVAAGVATFLEKEKRKTSPEGLSCRGIWCICTGRFHLARFNTGG